MATATDEEKLNCLLKRAFYDDRALFDRFSGYADGFRVLHPSGEGNTSSARDRQVRLDYAFVPEPFERQLTRCEVVRDVVSTRNASDHFPLLTELRI
jgi:endonuclease/exonuclease/phosphatase family metal-dependent hydrolase